MSSERKYDTPRTIRMRRQHWRERVASMAKFKRVVVIPFCDEPLPTSDVCFSRNSKHTAPLKEDPSSTRAMP